MGRDGLAEAGGVAEEAIELGIFNRFFDGLRLAGVVNAVVLDSISAISISEPVSSLIGTYIKTFSYSEKTTVVCVHRLSPCLASLFCTSIMNLSLYYVLFSSIIHFIILYVAC